MSSDDKTEPKADKGSEQDEGPTFPEGIVPQLELLITLANGKEFQSNAPVTVLVSGVQVSGLVVGWREAQKWFLKTYSEANRTARFTFADGPAQPERADEFRKAMSQAGEEALPRMLAGIDNAPPAKGYNFLYLKNARVWGAGREPLRPEMFAIRLDRIDAFMLGEPSQT